MGHHSFPYLGTSLTQHVKRFATSPLPVFEAEMAGTGTDVPEVMSATARCLAICVKACQFAHRVSGIVADIVSLTSSDRSKRRSRQLYTLFAHAHRSAWHFRAGYSACTYHPLERCHVCGPRREGGYCSSRANGGTIAYGKHQHDRDGFQVGACYRQIRGKSIQRRDAKHFAEQVASE